MKTTKTTSAKPAETKTAAAPKAAKPTLSAERMLAIKAAAHATVAALSVRSCGCGCGAPTKSTFAPGHDAKLASRLVKEQVEAELAAQAQKEDKPPVRLRPAKAAKAQQANAA